MVGSSMRDKGGGGRGVLGSGPSNVDLWPPGAPEFRTPYTKIHGAAPFHHRSRFTVITPPADDVSRGGMIYHSRVARESTCVWMEDIPCHRAVASFRVTLPCPVSGGLPPKTWRFRACKDRQPMFGCGWRVPDM